jgi:hypothetical protein
MGMRGCGGSCDYRIEYDEGSRRRRRCHCPRCEALKRERSAYAQDATLNLVCISFHVDIDYQHPLENLLVLHGLEHEMN